MLLGRSLSFSPRKRSQERRVKGSTVALSPTIDSNELTHKQHKQKLRSRKVGGHRSRSLTDFATSLRRSSSHSRSSSRNNKERLFLNSSEVCTHATSIFRVICADQNDDDDGGLWVYLSAQYQRTWTLRDGHWTAGPASVVVADFDSALLQKLYAAFATNRARVFRYVGDGIYNTAKGLGNGLWTGVAAVASAPVAAGSSLISSVGAAASYLRGFGSGSRPSSPPPSSPHEQPEKVPVPSPVSSAPGPASQDRAQTPTARARQRHKRSRSGRGHLSFLGIRLHGD